MASTHQEHRFDGLVAIVTGAGGSLGRQYALCLARNGAKVVVNDFNVEQAKAVVKEITDNGGIAIANGDGVTEGEKVVNSAISAWGRLDILINNAGILRDVSFPKMTVQQWQQVMDVHLFGSFMMTKAAWPHLKNSGNGRVIMITSVSGLYGSFGQANYSAAKMGLVGLTKTLAKEGSRHSIMVNAVAPGAGSAMTLTVMPKEVVEAWKPDYVAPVVAYMCHPSFKQTGKIFEVGGGYVGEVHWARTKGLFLDIDGGYDVDTVAKLWPAAVSREGESDPEMHKGIGPQLQQVVSRLEALKKSKL